MNISARAMSLADAPPLARNNNLVDHKALFPFSQFINRGLLQINIYDYKDAKTSNHSLRKAAAIKEFNRTGDKEGTSKFLGHNRTNIVDTYTHSK